MGLNVIVAIGLNLLIGYAGQISLGHAAFFGMGAYLSGIFTTNFDILARIPPWFSIWLLPWAIIFIAMLLTGAFAYSLGIPTLKLKGNYLVMATLGFNIIIEIVLIDQDAITGGANGLAGLPYLTLGGFLFDTDLKYYYLIWSLALLILILSFNLINSRVGRALKAIHGSEVAANTLGINIQRYKVKVFALSAMFASLAGSLYAHYITVITPKSCDVGYSIHLVIMVIVGGLGNLWGPLFGAALVVFLSEFLHIAENFNTVSFGLILVLVMIFFPDGLMPGIVKMVRKRLAKSSYST
jgi:branched-chain amino acid transport system permease protein